MENAYGAVLANYTVNDFAFSEILIPNIGQFCWEVLSEVGVAMSGLCYEI